MTVSHLLSLLHADLIHTTTGGRTVQLTRAAGILTVSADGSNAGYSRTIPSDGEVFGPVVVDLDRLRGLLGGLPKGAPCELSVRGVDGRGGFTPRGSTLHIAAGSASVGLPIVDDAPSLLAASGTLPEEAEAWSLSGSDVARLLSVPMYAAAKDGNRQNLNGGHLESVGGRLAMTCTDGHRMHHVEVDIIDAGDELPARHLVPPVAAVMARLVAGAPVVRIRVGRRLSLEADGVSVWAQMIEGEFPDYRAVVPRVSARWTCDADALVAGCRVVDSASDGKPVATRISLTRDGMTLAFRGGEAEARAVVDCEGDAVMETGIRPAYLREAIGALDTVRVEVGSTGQPLQPLRLAGEHEHDYAVIMPMRLD